MTNQDNPEDSLHPDFDSPLEVVVYAAFDRESGNYYSFCHPNSEHILEWREANRLSGFEEHVMPAREMCEHIRNTHFH